MSTSLKKNYVSDLDQFLQQLHKDCAESSAVIQREAEKHARIAQLRDQPGAVACHSLSQNELWEHF